MATANDADKLKHMLINFCYFEERPGLFYGKRLVPTKNYERFMYRRNNVGQEVVAICKSLNAAYNSRNKIYPTINSNITEYTDELNKFNKSNNLVSRYYNNPEGFSGAGTRKRRRNSSKRDRKTRRN